MTWDETIVATRRGNRGHAKYHPFLKAPDIQRLELRCIQEEGAAIIPPKATIIEFFMEVTDLGFPLGASYGSITSFIYVEYQRDGTVHGRPMTPDELKTKRRNAQTR
jgi:hypothetical protein